jgi:Family of unknown function (DUF6510)
MTMENQAFLDGNAAAGELREVFAVDITTAIGQCAGCGRVAPMADMRLYMRAPGLVARCPRCGRVLMRFVKGTAGRAWLDMRGFVYVQLSVPAEAGVQG